MSPARTAVRVLRPHRDLLSNSGALLGSSVVTSALGFVFWWLAARVASQDTVGAASAAASAMTLIGTIGMFGLGTLLIAELPRMRTGQWRLMSAAILVAGVLSTVGGAAYVLLGRSFSAGLRHTIGSPGAAVLLVVGISATAMTLVLDEGLVGLLAGTVQLRRNAAFAAGKLALLVGLVALPIVITQTELLAVWVGSILGSVALLALLRGRPRPGSLRPHLSALRALRGRALDHYLLNMALFLPRAALPLVVTVVLSASATAGFYTAWMVVTVLAMIPGHLATTLFAVGTGDLRVLRGKVRVALAVALAAGVPLSLVTAACARPVMSVFGSGYAASASGALAVLALTYVPTVIRQLYVAVSRVLGQVRRASALAVGAGVVELAAATYGGAHGGLTALARDLAVVFVIEALLMAPTVLRVVRARPAGRSPARPSGTRPRRRPARRPNRRPGRLDQASRRGVRQRTRRRRRPGQPAK